LVNIVTEYFLIKSSIAEFIRTAPKSESVLKVIDSSETRTRVEVILKILKDNLHKFEKIPENDRKRRISVHEADEHFNISHTNTSTPESLHPSKKRCHNASIKAFSESAKNDQKTLAEKLALARRENGYLSSPNTSTKEDDHIEEPNSVDVAELKVKSSATSPINCDKLSTKVSSV